MLLSSCEVIMHQMSQNHLLSSWQEEEVCEKFFLVRVRLMGWMGLTYWSKGWPQQYYVVLDR